jgi:hypothetical protein
MDRLRRPRGRGGRDWSGRRRRRRSFHVPALTRNLLILAVIAAIITGTGQASARALSAVLIIANLALFGALLYFGYTIWRANRGTFDLMESRLRYALYGCSIALALVVLSAPLWVRGFASSAVFFLLLGALGYAIWRLWQESRRYYY